MSIYKISRPIAINNTKSFDPSAQTAKLKTAAKLYEKQFLREMVKAMRQTISPSEMTKPSMAEKIYREKLDHQYVESWADKGGVGLGDMIYDQLKQRYFPASRLSPPKGPLPVEKMRRPLPTKDGHDVQKPIEIKGDSRGVSLMFSKEALGDQATEVTAPWAGEVTSSWRDESGRWYVQIENRDQQLSSLLSFLGSRKPMAGGDQLEAGESIGLIQPNLGPFVWRVTNKG